MKTADVCLILEGTYPHVVGGVSNWTHDLITDLREFTFHLAVLAAPGADVRPRYKVPPNVTGQTVIEVQKFARGNSSPTRAREIARRVSGPVDRLCEGSGLEALRTIVEALAPHRAGAGEEDLLNSPAAWESLLARYERIQPDGSFLDYFWAWRALVGGMYSVLLPDLPEACIYHPVCTGYAGLMAARAHIETRRPVVLTEHGIYTSERRLEIALADWLHDDTKFRVAGPAPPGVKDFWTGIFTGYSKACYEAACAILTVFEGNQKLQQADGADPAKMRVIPNGVDTQRYGAVVRKTGHPPTVALIGRVVPIKDVNTFLRACALLRQMVPDLRAWVLGPTEEDPEYYRGCRRLVQHLGLANVVTFTGSVTIGEYLGEIDLLCLTSISEVQPLVILEAGAAGVPAVATDVGACRELILGASWEDPPLGPAGAVTPLSAPRAMAEAAAALLLDQDRYEAASRTIRERVHRYYAKHVCTDAYRRLYRSLLDGEGAPGASATAMDGANPALAASGAPQSDLTVTGGD
jgi:polysaccharide biosynthesis protein PelF